MFITVSILYWPFVDLSFTVMADIHCAVGISAFFSCLWL